MKIAIMQPYLFPYIGYWQLINAVDTFVIYDDVNFIKGGYINRNLILLNGKAHRFTLQLIGASQNKFINEIERGQNQGKLIKTITLNYKKAPFFSTALPLIEDILLSKEINLSRFIGNSLISICNYLDIKVKLIYSSDIEKDNCLKGQDKIIEICKRLSGSHYINPIGGVKLYDKEEFDRNGIKLNFLRPEINRYKQFTDKFVPNLSIIDIMMFNSKKEIHKMLQRYELI